MSNIQDPRPAIHRLNIVGVLVVLLLVGIIGGWSASAKLAGAVIASGQLVVKSYVKQIQPPSGGVVGDILVHEGSFVHAGDLLVRLDPTVPKATLGVVQAQIDELTARQARLIAERDGTDAVQFPADLVARASIPTVASAIAGEKRLFESRRAANAGQRSQLREQIAEMKQEIAGLDAQLAGKQDEIGLISKELVGVNDLFQQNLVTMQRMMQLKRDQAKLEGERGSIIADKARAGAKISELEVQIAQIDRDFMKDVLSDLRQAEGKLAELRQQYIQAADELHHTEIRAPIGGTVYHVMVHTVGGVIGKGETIMEIVPHRDQLIVEAKVPPHDVDEVVVGASAAVRVLAGNQRLNPQIDGTVIYVSPDINVDTGAKQQAGAAPYYLVRISLPADQLSRLHGLQLVPGMAAAVFIQTQERTALQYMIKPLYEQVTRTFRER